MSAGGKVLTRTEDVPDATMVDLLATYRHFAGRVARGFESRIVAERRVIEAIMSSADLRGHLGVPKDSRPAPTEFAALVQSAADSRRDDPHAMAREGLPGSQAGVECDPETNPYPVGSLAARLWATAAGEPPPPLAREDAEASARRVAARADRTPIVGAGATGWVRACAVRPAARLQPTSLRAEVFEYIDSAAGRTASVSAILTKFGPPARGCIAKLRAKRFIDECPAPSQTDSN